MRGAPQEERHQQRRAIGRRSRNNANAGGRWAWARDLLTARSEEGLDEFGEAPPPYDGRRRGSKIQAADDVVELEARPSGTTAGSGSGSGAAGRSGQNEEDLESGWASLQGLPPAYDGPPGAAPEGTAFVSMPPPAVTHVSHSAHLAA